MRLAPQAGLQTNPAIRFFARSVCRSLARFGILFGIPFNSMAQALKEAYVEVASEELKKSKQEPLDSKVAFMTGIPRKAVPAAKIPKEEWESIPFTNVLGYWIREPQFHDEAGRPGELPINAKDEPSFADLVQQFCGKDISVNVVLDFLEKSENIEKTDYGTVRLLKTHASDEDLELAVTFGANSIAWHLGTTVENLRILANGEDLTGRLYDRKRYSRSIPLKKIPELKSQFSEIFREADCKVEILLDRYEVPDQSLGTCLFGAGIYSFLNSVKP